MALLFTGTPTTSVCRASSNLPIFSLHHQNRQNSPTQNIPSRKTTPTHIAFARRVSSRTKKLEKPEKNISIQEEEEEPPPESLPEDLVSDIDDGFVLPELPGDKDDFWEGPQWNWLGFFVQYMWAFGIGFALIACGIAVATYNEGATDFKKTPAYKESIQSRDLFEEPDASSADIFEANPTEEAPSLE